MTNVAAIFVSRSGFAVNAASGATVSTVQVDVAGDASVLPAGSVATTLNVWLPSARAEGVKGLVQAAVVVPSRVHAKVESASLEVKVNGAVGSFVGFPGLAVIVVSGTVASYLSVADPAPWFPAASVQDPVTVARSESGPEKVTGVEQTGLPLVASVPWTAKSTGWL
jgi:hypothetical protein